MQLQQHSKQIQIFLYSLKSKETQHEYLKSIKYFEDFAKRKLEDFLILKREDIESILIEYIIFMREKKLAHNTVKNRMNPIIGFLDLNDITIKTKKLSKFYGEQVKTIKDEAYSREDIQLMLSHASFRTKVILLIYASTGIRKGALIDLKLKHLKRIDNIYRFTIYENSREEYITFCTPETAEHIDSYLDYRKQQGEKITEESYLIRKEFLRDRARDPQQITALSLSDIMINLLKKTNLQTTNHKTENYQYKRHKKASFHGFRKWFNTCLVNCNVNISIKESLLGHSLGLDDSYFRPTEQQLLTEYLKAVNELTINDENRLKIKVKKLEIDQSLLQRLNDEVARIKQDMVNRMAS